MPSRHDEQVIEVTRIDLAPEYYYKAVPVLTSHVYRLADVTNKSSLVLLPGEATMYIGSDFVGQMTLPLVAIGEQLHDVCRGRPLTGIGSRERLQDLAPSGPERLGNVRRPKKPSERLFERGAAVLPLPGQGFQEHQPEGVDVRRGTGRPSRACCRAGSRASETPATRHRSPRSRSRLRRTRPKAA